MLFVVIAMVGDSGSSSSSSSARSGEQARAPSSREVRAIARRVERVRDLRFRHVPLARRVTAAQARRDGLADFDRSYPARRRRADQELLELLGLVPPRTDLRRVFGTVFREQVGGYYDPRTKRLAVVAGASGGPALQEITLAHELNHALEDQRYGLESDGSQNAIDDASLANTALIEGTATSVMLRYAQRFLDPGRALADLIPAALAQSGATKLPEYLEATLLFPYEGGQAFVDRLYGTVNGWGLVDYALRRRRPASTEQVIHPDKYLEAERPLPVRVLPASAVGPGWRRLTTGTLGEFDTRQLLGRGNPDTADRAAAGWGGGRYVLYEQGGPRPGCASPCRRRDALVLSWRWDTPRDAQEAREALPGYLARALHARGIGNDRFALPGGAAALALSADATALAFAPTAATAARLANASVAHQG